VMRKLIPSLKSYSINNRKIIDLVDRGRVHDIMHRLSKQVARQSSLPALTLCMPTNDRRSILFNFL
jgi:hypothetical protein